jgi:deoxyribodipyrimidine photo-lyase
MRALHWFRNDLRLRDNVALGWAAGQAQQVLPVFVLDTRLLEHSKPRAAFLLDCLERLAADLERRGSQLVVLRGRPEKVLPKLARSAGVTHVVCNRDTTPFARRRDAAVAAALARAGIAFTTHKDRVIHESSEIRTNEGRPYAVYTPYRNRWWEHFRESPPEERPRLRLPPAPAGIESEPLPKRPSLTSGFELATGGEAAARRRLDAFVSGPLADYASLRDIPAVDGTSRLSPHLRFGTISVRRCLQAALEAAAADRRIAAGARKWADELIWREFYAAILEEHPRVLKGPYREAYAELEWDDAPDRLAAWADGQTGYPFVDAAMRQLARTGWMHNRARMVVASFLTKDLGIDWRAGERVFAERLLDFDPASNNGGWQWSASTGTDAQPYFRIFNPVSQGERFDPDGEYIRRFVPELAGASGRDLHRPWQAPLASPAYPPPIVDHGERRKIALARYEAARASGARR